MSIIHTVLTPTELNRICQQDRDYLRRKLEVNCLLNNLLHRPINRPLLAELRCILDSEPIPRQKTERSRTCKVRVYNVEGNLIRIEHNNGKVMRYV